MIHVISMLWVLLAALKILLGFPLSQESFQMLQLLVGIGHKTSWIEKYSSKEKVPLSSSQVHITREVSSLLLPWDQNQLRMLHPPGYCSLVHRPREAGKHFGRFLAGSSQHSKFGVWWLTACQPKYSSSNFH